MNNKDGRNLTFDFWFPLFPISLVDLKEGRGSVVCSPCSDNPLLTLTNNDWPWGRYLCHQTNLWDIYDTWCNTRVPESRRYLTFSATMESLLERLSTWKIWTRDKTLQSLYMYRYKKKTFLGSSPGEQRCVWPVWRRVVTTVTYLFSKSSPPGNVVVVPVVASCQVPATYELLATSRGDYFSLPPFTQVLWCSRGWHSYVSLSHSDLLIRR